MLLQPLYFPWMGVFDMIAQCDLLIFYDDAQFVKQSWQSRNRIKTPNGAKWLSIPIDRSCPLGAKISEIRVNHAAKWRERHLNQIREAYRKTPYFDLFFPRIESFLEKSHESLVSYSAGSMILAAGFLGIRTPVRYSSEFRINDCRGPEKVAKICRAAAADTYLDSAGGRKLYDPSFFFRRGIEISFHQYSHPVYRQFHGDFVSHLSVLDLLFNEGPGSRVVLQSGGRALERERVSIGTANP